MGYVSIMLNLTGRKVVVIGGGEEALKKVGTLLPQCDEIAVIAAEFSNGFSGIPVKKIKMRLDDEILLDNFVNERTIVIIATNNTSLNRRIENYCRTKNIIFNSVDNRNSEFIFPASFELSGVTVSVSTSGRSPSFARFLRDALYVHVSNYAQALPVLERLRHDVKIEDLHAKASFFNKLLNDRDFWNLIDSGEYESAYLFGIKEYHSTF
ncbi:MAG: precorrin-2 dehydrogenase/sirohydrochlorin ferrochelatase family protein [Thermoplasmata archaeon]